MVSPSLSFFLSLSLFLLLFQSLFLFVCGTLSLSPSIFFLQLFLCLAHFLSPTQSLAISDSRHFLFSYPLFVPLSLSLSLSLSISLSLVYKEFLNQRLSLLLVLLDRMAGRHCSWRPSEVTWKWSGCFCRTTPE